MSVSSFLPLLRHSLFFLQKKGYCLQNILPAHSHRKGTVDGFFKIRLCFSLPCLQRELFVESRYIRSLSVNRCNKSFLFQLVQSGCTRDDLDSISERDLTQFLNFSADYAALTVGKMGADMATMEEMKRAYGV